MKKTTKKIKLYYIVLVMIFLYLLLDFYNPVQAQILNNYEQQMIQISSSSGGVGITDIITMVFTCLRLYWFSTGIFLIYVALQSYFYNSGNSAISQLGVFFSIKSFGALSIINFAYSLVEPIINRANI